jgi:hypothetical protein
MRRPPLASEAIVTAALLEDMADAVDTAGTFATSGVPNGGGLPIPAANPDAIPIGVVALIVVAVGKGAKRFWDVARKKWGSSE